MATGFGNADSHVGALNLNEERSAGRDRSLMCECRRRPRQPDEKDGGRRRECSWKAEAG